MKKLLQMTLLIMFTSLALAGVVYAKTSFTINSPEVGDVAGHLSMEGHSEHDIATCTTKQRYYTEISDMMNEGFTKQEILDHYEAMYGEQGFREPSRSGFSMLAWTVPFIMLGAGAIFLFSKMKKQAGPKIQDNLPVKQHLPETADSAEDDLLSIIIEEEKKKRF